MREEIARLPVDPGVVCYLQRLSYEADGLRVLNTHVARAGEWDEAVRDRLLREYREAYAAYRTAFDALVGEMTGGTCGQCRFVLDFMAEALIVYGGDRDG